MSDKFRRTQPLNITFAEGEAPTAPKLTKVASQSRVGSRLIEKAIGDLWNQSGDALLNAYPLQIPNLARLIGAASYLNPVLYELEGTFTYVDNIGTKYANMNEAPLQFPASGNPTNFAGAVLTTLKATIAEVDSAGDYYYDSVTNKVYSFSMLTSADKISYTVDTSEWINTDEVLPCIIPDPRQTQFTGCRVSTSGGKYYLDLPIRCPLTLTNWNLPDRYPPAADWADNYDYEESTFTRYLWDPNQANTPDTQYYRYRLPKEILDNASSLAVGDALPEGFLYIWDQTTNTIIEDIVFKKRYESTSIYSLEISSDTTDLSTKVSGSDTEAGYNSTGYSLIVCGAPLTRYIKLLEQTARTAKHDNSGDLTALLDHKNLLGNNLPGSSHADHNGAYSASAPEFYKSRWAGDHHSQYLSRAGSFGTSTSYYRDINDNAMQGDMVFAGDTASGGNYLTLTANSRKLFFGKADLTDSPYIYSTGYGGKLSIQNAYLSLEPSLTPSNPANGDLYILSGGVQRLQVYDSANWGKVVTQINATTVQSNNITGNSEQVFTTSYTLPANAVQVGTTLRIRATGCMVGHSGTDTCVLRLRIGGVGGTLIAMLTLNGLQAATDGFYMEGLVTVRAIGASGSIMAGGFGMSGAATLGNPYYNGYQQSGGSVAIDTTATQQVVATAQWNTASASNLIRLDQLVVDIA